MRFSLLPLLLSLGCTTPAKGTADTARPLRPTDDADEGADADDPVGVDGDADGTTADGGAEDTGEEEEVSAPYALQATPAEVTFGAVSVGETRNQMVDIKNVGTESVHLNGLGVSDRTIFDIRTDFGDYVTLTPGMERSISVDFTPAEDRGYTAEITLVTEEVLAENADIPLQGRGESGPCEICSPIIDVHPTNVDITDLFSCEATESVTVTNEGDRPLRITAVNIINGWPSCGNFTRSWGGAVTLAPFDSTSIVVTYRATAECADIVSLSEDANTMHIISNDPSDSDVTVGLSGAVACLFGK